MHNPFFWRGIVKLRDAFIGREREMRSIFSRLRSLGSVSVVGRRRIGKSSLLYQTCDRMSERLGEEYVGVYIDMLSARHHTLDGLLLEVLRGIGGDSSLMAKNSPGEKLADFEDGVREVRARALMPVVFVNEFEGLVARTEGFGDNVLESWRSLGDDGQIAFVTGSQRSLTQVERARRLTSPFYNIFSQVRLAEFTDEETDQFAAWALRTGAFSRTDMAFILRTGNRDPLRLQVAAWHLFEAKEAAVPDLVDVEERVTAEMAAMLGQD